jgi:chromate transporter
VAQPPSAAVPISNPHRPLTELLRLFLRLGVVGFGGPTAHIALMDEEIVEKRRWIPRGEFIDALAATNMVPGPNSTEMAIHVGYRRGGVAGAIIAGVSFIGPAFVLMLALSWAYFRWQDLASVADVFDGIKPAVIAVLTVTLWRLFRSSVKDVPQFALMCGAGALAYWYAAWEPLILLAAGGAGVALFLSPRSYPKLPLLSFAPWPLVLVPIAAAAAFTWEPGALVNLAALFLRAGGLLFGGGYVLIPLVEDDVVGRFAWLTRQQFLDGVALGQVTPGPIIITATFVGYGAAGLPGAVVATTAVFAPSFIIAIATARFLDRIRSWTVAQAFLKGVGPAVVGSIAAVSASLGRDAITGGWTAGIFVAGLALAWRFGPIPALALAGTSGIIIGATT